MGDFIGYVVIEHNQASRQPELLPYSDLFHDRQGADERAEWERGQTAKNGRGETYAVARVVIDND